MSDRLTPSQVYALAVLDSADPRYEGEGVVTSGETHMSSNQAWVNWRTAEALERRGLARIRRIDGVGASIWPVHPERGTE